MDGDIAIFASFSIVNEAVTFFEIDLMGLEMKEFTKTNAGKEKGIDDGDISIAFKRICPGITMDF